MKPTHKRFLAFLLSVSMLMTLLPTAVVWAEDTGWTGQGNYSTAWYDNAAAGTDGSFAKPYQLATAADLAGLAVLTNGLDGKTAVDFSGKYIEIADTAGAMNLAGKEWTPIGTAEKPFTGCFDGNNVQIQNMSITAAPAGYAGLFGSIDGADIRNVAMTGVSIQIEPQTETEEPTRAGAVAGGGTGVLDTVSAAGSISVTRTADDDTHVGVQAGGIAGQASALRNAAADVDVTVTLANAGEGTETVMAGGIVGSLAGELANAYALGDVSTTAKTLSAAGGLAGGIADIDGTAIKNAYFAGTATAVSDNGNAYNNGIIAYALSAGDGASIVNNAYYQADATEGSGLTEVQMKAAAGTEGALVDLLNQYITGNSLAKEFAPWSVSADANGGYPAFTPIARYKLVVTAPEHGTLAADVSGEYLEGEKIALSLTPEEGYTFAGWTAAGGGSFADASKPETEFTMPAADVAITATLNAPAPVLESWTAPGNYDTSWYDDARDEGVDGTQNDPYLLRTEEDLAGLAVIVNGLNGVEQYDFSGEYIKFRSKDDTLDLSGKQWTPIGDEEHRFRGSLLGNGAVLKNLTIGTQEQPNTELNNAGLFGVTRGTTVTDLELSAVGIYVDTEGANIGALAGQVTNGDATDAPIKNVKASGVLVGANGNGSNGIGGIVGYCDGAIMDSSVSDLTVTSGDRQAAGGIAGRAKEPQMVNLSAYPTDDVTLTAGANSSVGGLIGEAEDAGRLRNSFARVTITAGERGVVGGIVGSNESTAVENCYSSSALTTGANGVIGSIQGSVSGTNSVSDCHWDEEQPQTLDGEAVDPSNQLTTGESESGSLTAGGTARTADKMTAQSEESGALVDRLNKWVDSNASGSNMLIPRTWIRTDGENDNYPYFDEVKSNTFRLTIQAESRCTITEGESGWYEKGERIEVSAKADSGYSIRWRTSDGGTFDSTSSASTTFKMPGNDVTITATAVRNNNYGGGGGGGGNGSYNPNPTPVPTPVPTASATPAPVAEPNDDTKVPSYTDGDTTRLVPFSAFLDGEVKYIRQDGVEYTIADNAKAFSDVSGHWAKDAINFVTARELFGGVGDNLFDPNAPMTRGMFVTVLGRLWGVNAADYTASPFTDVPQSEWYAPYVQWANENGIVRGIGEGEFAPNKQVTRQEMATMLQKFADFTQYALGNTTDTATVFDDQAAIADWAVDAVQSIQMAGIINGKEGNVFDPLGTATRAEVASVLRRYIENVVTNNA